MFAICFTQTKLTSINSNDEINYHSFQTIYLIVAQFLKQKLIFLIKLFYIVSSLISITIFIMFIKILFNYQGKRSHF
jgi:hypothetical protein